MKKYFLITTFALAALSANAQTATTDPGVVINDVKWATRNVDAPGTFAAKPEDPGMLYQWNRKTAWSATNPGLGIVIGEAGGWDTTIPTGNTWEKANDPSPAGWKVPTLDDIKKLLDNDKVENKEWTDENGVYGRKFTDKASGNSLFLPAVGSRFYAYGTLNFAGEFGYYWSNAPIPVGVGDMYESRESYNPDRATITTTAVDGTYELYQSYNLFFFYNGVGYESNSRRVGRSVRSVAE